MTKDIFVQQLEAFTEAFKQQALVNYDKAQMAIPEYWNEQVNCLLVRAIGKLTAEEIFALPITEHKNLNNLRHFI